MNLFQTMGGQLVSAEMQDFATSWEFNGPVKTAEKSTKQSQRPIHQTHHWMQ